MTATAAGPRRPWMAAGLSAVVFPGAGQVYNRQVAKGVAFIALSLACTVAITVMMVRIAMAAIQANPDMIDPSQTQRAVEQAVRSGAGGLSATVWALTLLWVVSVVDAYLVARRSSAAAAATMPR
jgi:TM2 domain-containing membrane protein YozV